MYVRPYRLLRNATAQLRLLSRQLLLSLHLRGLIQNYGDYLLSAASKTVMNTFKFAASNALVPSFLPFPEAELQVNLSQVRHRHSLDV